MPEGGVFFCPGFGGMGLAPEMYGSQGVLIILRHVLKGGYGWFSTDGLGMVFYLLNFDGFDFQEVKMAAVLKIKIKRRRVTTK